MPLEEAIFLAKDEQEWVPNVEDGPRVAGGRAAVLLTYVNT